MSSDRMPSRLVWAAILAGLVVGSATSALWQWWAAPFGGAAGAIIAWAWTRHAVDAAMIGAGKGAFFLALIGPGLDWVSNRPPTVERMVAAIVSGALVGAALGVRNHRVNRGGKSRPVEEPGVEPG